MATPKRTATKTHPDQAGTILNIETNLLIAKGSVIKEFCDDKAEAKRRVGKINDGFNKTAAAKVEKDHLHLQAANDAYRLQAMEDKELHEYLYHFLFYVKDLGLLERTKKQEELFSADETGPSPKATANGHDKDDGKGDAGDGSDATTRIGAAARKVAEAAGASMPK